MCMEAQRMQPPPILSLSHRLVSIVLKTKFSSLVPLPTYSKRRGETEYAEFSAGDSAALLLSVGLLPAVGGGRSNHWRDLSASS